MTWYPEPHYQYLIFNEEGPQNKIGTFRHANCNRVVPADKHSDAVCVYCRQIPSLKSFRKRVLCRNGHTGTNRSFTGLKYEDMSNAEAVERLRHMQSTVHTLKSENFLLKQENLRLKLRVRKAKTQLTEYASRGDIKAICARLNKASDQGLLKDQGVLKDFLETVSQNFHVSKNGKRYKTSVQEFYEVLLIWGGPRLACFVCDNMFGPNIDTVHRWKRQNTKCFEPGVEEDNFKTVADIYKAAIEKHNIIYQPPTLICEDETAIEARVEYNQRLDALIGFCGVKSENPADHQCLDKFVIPVGEGQNGYDNIVGAFRDYKVGSHARLLAINPLHPKLPKIPIVLMPTCNKFDHKFVFNQWQQVERLYDKYLTPVLGPILGHSSDGDSRRRLLMMKIAMASLGEMEFRPIEEKFGFIFCAKKILIPNTNKYNISDLMDQDTIHCHKKLINPLDHEIRILQIGPYIVHMNHLLRVLQEFPGTLHGLTRDDILKRDRQNWKSAQKICFKVVRDCLQQIEDGHEDHAPDQSVKGTRIYLSVIARYVDIFFSTTHSLADRIKKAGFFCHFVSIWRNYTIRNRQKTLKHNFLTRECFQDCILSVQFAAMLIIYYRDNFPNEPCPLDQTGSEPCEVLFSSYGQWVGNHHNFWFGEMLRNTSAMIRLEMIRTLGQGLVFRRAHEKQENIWPKQYDGLPVADLTDYPAPGEEVVAWKNGMTEARQLAAALGMGPVGYRHDNFHPDDNDGDDGDDGDDDDDWFFCPLKRSLFSQVEIDMLLESCEPVPNEACCEEIHYEECGTEQNQMLDNGEIHPDYVDPQLSREFREMLDGLELDDELESRIESVGVKTNPQVMVPNHGAMYKSTLVKLLNENPKLSKDRLVRVRHRGSESNDTRTLDNSIELFSDCAFERNVEGTKSVMYVKVQRMRKAGATRGYIEYRNPVTADEKLEIISQVYEECGINENEILLILSSNTICLSSHQFLGQVDLTFQRENAVYALQKDVHKVFLSTIQKCIKTHSKTRKLNPTAVHTEVSENVVESVDGTVRVIVEPSPSSSDMRRSSRKRTLLIRDG